MFRRDYFMRQIEQMTVVLHRILFNKEHIPIGDAQQLLDEASRHLLGLNVRSLLALSSKDILELLTYQGNTDTGKALVLGDLFMGNGDMYRQNEQFNDAYVSYLKSLDLVLLLVATPSIEDPDMSKEASLRIAQSLERLQSWVLPEQIMLRLFGYYESQGEYAKAEDIIFHFMDDYPGRAELAKAHGILFYERLLDTEETILFAGNFSKEEAEEGLRLLQNRQIL
ncbi:DUF6483 family protein [Paenibacillus sp. SI8]|uniref:DUF6483 family protein n=1 Tax=unclassified Paenibacillus TaxID=185978 RepID=UPI003465DED7